MLIYLKNLLIVLCLLFTSAASAQLSAPSVISPGHTSNNKKVTEYFGWSIISGATHYEVQIDTVNTFTSGFAFTVTSNANTEYISELLFGKRHYVRARAMDGQTPGFWSQIIYFNTINVPDVLSFTSGQAFVASIIVTYNTGAYLEHQLDTSPNFNSPSLKTIKSIHADSNTVIYRDLMFEQKYYFRARSFHNKDTTEWIATRNFMTLTGSSMYPVDNNALVQKYTWTAGYYTNITYPGVSYQLELDTTLLFNSPVFYHRDETNTFFDDLLSDRYTFGSKWYVRVRTFTPVDTSDWEILNFTVFQKPIIVSPTVNTKDPLPLLTKVGSHPGVDFFLFRLDTTSDFSSPLLVEDTLNNTPLSPSRTLGIPHFARYWYGVRAVNGQDTSKESVLSFLINDVVPAINPANNATNLDVEATFSWTDPKNVSFQLQLDSMANFGSTPERIYSIAGNKTSADFGELYYGMKNYWRMRVVSAVDTGNWQAARSFTTKAAPVPTYPYTATSDYVKTLDLTCDAIYGSDFYEFEISALANFSNSWRDTAVYDSIWDEVPFSLNRFPLNYSTQYFWRVRAIHSRDTSAWSVAWNFTTAAELPKPPQVELVSPADKSTGHGVNVTCEWKRLDDVYYWFQFHTDPGFGPGTDSTLILFIGNVNPTEILTNLQKGKTYYWRVKAVNDEKEGEWSATWSFTIQPVLVTPNPLFPVSLSNQGTYITLKWSKVNGALSYRYRFGLSSNLTGVTPISTTDTFAKIGPLQENKVYYWHVNALRGSEQTAYSAVVFFETGEGVGLDGFSNGSDVVYPNPARQFITIQTGAASVWSYQVFSMDGKDFGIGKFMDGEPISISRLPAGIYWIRIETDADVKTFKFIKEE